MAALVIYLFVLIFKNILLNWYKEFIYSGVKIDGTWNVESGSYERRTVVIEISQRANVITGLSTHAILNLQHESRRISLEIIN